MSMTEIEKLQKYYKSVNAYYKQAHASPQDLLRKARKDLDDFDNLSHRSPGGSNLTA